MKYLLSLGYMNEYIAKVKAVQFTGSNLEQVRKIAPKARKPNDIKDVLIVATGSYPNIREVLVSVGDYVLVQKNGVVLVFDAEAFRQNFDLSPAKPLPKVRFVYDKRDGSAPSWRTLEVTSEDNSYIEGVEQEGGEFKRFLKSRIVGGEIIRL